VANQNGGAGEVARYDASHCPLPLGEGERQPVVERGKFASWIAPPKVGIDNKPGDFEYVRIA